MSKFLRTPPPHPLGTGETLESLSHWKTTFHTYFKRDGAYKTFLRETASWDPTAADYGQRAVNGGLEGLLLT